MLVKSSSASGAIEEGPDPKTLQAFSQHSLTLFMLELKALKKLNEVC